MRRPDATAGPSGAGTADQAPAPRARHAPRHPRPRSATDVAGAAREVARAAFHLGGGASVRAGSAASNALRDLETVLTHRMVADRVRPATARAALAIGTTPPDL